MARARQPAAHKSLLEVAWPWVVRFVGISILLWETLAERVDRPSLLVAAVGMIGSAEFVRIGKH